MSNQKIIRKKLKAIVFADVVNFTEISSRDERKALNLIDKLNTIAKSIVIRHNGEWLKELGDGFLISFDSSLEAVRCSIAIQQSITEIDDLKIRVGIHQGDIYIKDGDVFGNDVNIASRVEGFSPEGGISLSDKVYKDISSEKDIRTAFIGHKTLKGVEQETKIRCITSHNLPKHKRILGPIIAAYICFFIAIICFTFTIGGPLTSLGCSECDIDDPAELYKILWLTIVTFVTGLSYLLVGYSCLSFSKGLSIKSQKFLVYLAYIYMIIPILLPVIKAQIQKPEAILQIIEYGPSMILAFLFLLAGFPLMTIVLFKMYYYFKKRSNWRIFKNDKIALLLYFLLFVILPIIVIAIIALFLHK